MKACSLRVPAHNLSIYLDRFADDLIDFMESKKMFKCPNSRDVSRATRQDDKQLKKTEPTIKDPTKQEFLELVHDLKEFVLQRTSVQGCKPVVFAGKSCPEWLVLLSITTYHCVTVREHEHGLVYCRRSSVSLCRIKVFQDQGRFCVFGIFQGIGSGSKLCETF